jgi:hypothetical protein
MMKLNKKINHTKRLKNITILSQIKTRAHIGQPAEHTGQPAEHIGQVMKLR